MRVAVVTTLNEQDSIANLVLSLQKNGCEYVVVVDAASEDDTVGRAIRAGATLISLEKRQPIAPCLLDGWKRALILGATEIVQIDAGGSHDANELPRFWEALAGTDMVIGSRFCKGATYVGGSKWRALGSQVAACLCSAATRRHMSDWTSGYRAFTSEAMRELINRPYRAKMHGWQIEVLANALSDEMVVAEVPITYRAGRSSLSFGVTREAFSVWQRLHSL